MKFELFRGFPLDRTCSSWERGCIWRERMWVLPQLLAFTPAGRPRLASPMAAFATTTPISAKLLMPPEAVSEVVSAMHSTTSTLAVVGPPDTGLVFSFFELVLLPYMAFACFIGWVSKPNPKPNPERGGLAPLTRTRARTLTLTTGRACAC